MPMGFKRFRILNESSKALKPTSYTSHADAWGEPSSQIIDEKMTGNIATKMLHSFPIIAGLEGIPGVLAVRASVQIVGGKKIDKWLLSSSWQGYEIQEVELIVDPTAAFATARIFLTDDYYEERIRFFST